MGGAMTDEMIDLGRRAVACKGWRWMPGMLADLTTPEYKPARVLSVQSGGYEPPMLEIAWSWDDGDGVHPRGWLPDLTDPATIGCLLALAREACEPERAPGDWPMVCTYQSAAKKWGVGAWLNESGKATFAALVLPTCDTEAAALVAALEAAPT